MLRKQGKMNPFNPSLSLELVIHIIACVAKPPPAEVLSFESLNLHHIELAKSYFGPLIGLRVISGPCLGEILHQVGAQYH